MKRPKSVNVPRLNMMRLKIYLHGNIEPEMLPALQRDKKDKKVEPIISIADALTNLK